jgi:hypothetical protein
MEVNGQLHAPAVSRPPSTPKELLVGSRTGLDAPRRESKHVSSVV